MKEQMKLVVNSGGYYEGADETCSELTEQRRIL